MTPLTAAIIPSNSSERIERCFQHLLRQTVQFERLILVAWGVTRLQGQKVIESAARIIRNVEVVEAGPDTRPEINLNAGITRLSKNPTDYVAFLNDDTYLDEKWHESMLKAGCSGGRRALYASVVQFVSDPRLVQSAGHVLNRSRPHDFHYKESTRQVRRLPSPLCPCGNAAFVPWDAIERVWKRDSQLWDPAFERWQSCFDFGLKMRLSGYDCHLIPSAHALHDGYLDHILTGGSLEERDVKNQLRSRLLLYGKFFPEKHRREAIQLLEGSLGRWRSNGYPGSRVKDNRITSLFETAEAESRKILGSITSYPWLEMIERLDAQSQRKLLFG